MECWRAEGRKFGHFEEESWEGQLKKGHEGLSGVKAGCERAQGVMGKLPERALEEAEASGFV